MDIAEIERYLCVDLVTEDEFPTLLGKYRELIQELAGDDQGNDEAGNGPS